MEAAGNQARAFQAAPRPGREILDVDPRQAVEAVAEPLDLLIELAVERARARGLDSGEREDGPDADTGAAAVVALRHHLEAEDAERQVRVDLEPAALRHRGAALHPADAHDDAFRVPADATGDAAERRLAGCRLHDGGPVEACGEVERDGECHANPE